MIKQPIIPLISILINDSIPGNRTFFIILLILFMLVCGCTISMAISGTIVSYKERWIVRIENRIMLRKISPNSGPINKANQNDELIKKNKKIEEIRHTTAIVRKRKDNFKNLFFSCSLTDSKIVCSSPNNTKDVSINLSRIK